MSFFANLFGGENEPKELTEHEAFAAVVVGAVAADGNISDEEVAGANAIFARMKLYSDMPSDRFRKMIDRVFRLLKQNGAQGILPLAAPRLSAQLKETAFAVAADLVLADGTVEGEEKAYLDALKAAFGITDEMARAVVGVLVMKNRG